MLRTFMNMQQFFASTAKRNGSTAENIGSKIDRKKCIFSERNSIANFHFQTNKSKIFDDLLHFVYTSLFVSAV